MGWVRPKTGRVTALGACRNWPGRTQFDYKCGILIYISTDVTPSSPERYLRIFLFFLLRATANGEQPPTPNGN